MSKRGRKRSGTLDYTKQDGYVVIYPELVDGERVKERYALGTHDVRVARIKKKRFIADLNAGRITPAEAGKEAGRAEYLFEACERVQAARKKAGIVSAGDARGRLRLYAYPECPQLEEGETPDEDEKEIEDGPEAGRIEVTKIETSHINAIFDYCYACGKSRQTIIHLRRALIDVFAALVREGAVRADKNPVDGATLPTMPTELVKERAVLTDAEFAKYLGYEHPQEHWRMAILETQVMTCMSRMFGGLRTGDLHAIKWESLDVVEGRFEWGWAPRRKSKRPQKLGFPDMLRPILRDWWERHGRPEEGLLFPARRGKRVGETKTKVSHARAFRRDLKRALGIEKWDAEARKYVPARAMTAREKELFTETAQTLPVDFHSWRRAYSQALADAGVNAQTAMALAGHATQAAHGRYLRNAGKMRELPAAALPQIAVTVSGAAAPSPPGEFGSQKLPKSRGASKKLNHFGGADGTRTRGLRRDRTKVHSSPGATQPEINRLAANDASCGIVKDGELPKVPSKLPADDAVAAALRAGLERAIDSGDAAAAAAIARELAARTAAVSDENVVPMRRAGRRKT